MAAAMKNQGEWMEGWIKTRKVVTVSYIFKVRLVFLCIKCINSRIFKISDVLELSVLGCALKKCNLYITDIKS